MTNNDLYADRFGSIGRVLVISHRGDNSRAPENTLPAFRSAMDLGARFVELDYQQTADGVPVVIHDAQLDRTTNALDVFGRNDMAITGMPWADVQRLDVGGWFDERFAGTPIATLEEALDAIQPRATTVIERKSGDARTLIQLLGRKQMLEQVVVMAFDWDFLADCHRLAPSLMLAALGRDPFDAAQLPAMAATGARIVGWNPAYIGGNEITAIHAFGLRAWVFWMNEPAQILSLLAGGIDGIITDFPGQTIPLVADRLREPVGVQTCGPRAVPVK